MQDFANKKIIVGVCGGIAAYKTAYLVRELKRLGATIQVVMTTAAQQFVTPMTFQALSGNPVRTALFDAAAEQAMGHIELARWADLIVIAPASANTIAKISHGLADDLLSTLCLVAEVPLIVCPAMNRSMWGHPTTQSHCTELLARGVMIVGPEEGSQACGEYGLGRMSEAETIINALRLVGLNNLLRGQTVLITAGPTREAIDPVRYISNQSSGKMGYALAQAALLAGANVTLISGPSSLTPPVGVHFCAVDSAHAMLDAVMAHLKPGMLFIGTAAVADYAPTTIAHEKIKKQDNPTLTLTLTPNLDILATVATSGKAALVVGFAAETTEVIPQATKKLRTKKADVIIANQVGNGQGFDSEYNQVTVCINTPNQIEEIAIPFNHKTRIAGQIVTILATCLSNKNFVAEPR